MLGGSLSKVISLIMLPFYTRWLSVEDYGISDIVTVYASLCVGLSTLCIAEAIFPFAKGGNNESQKKYFSSSLFFTFVLLIGVALIFVLLSWFSHRYGLKSSFFSYLWFVYAIILTTFLQTFTQQFACAINAMKVYSFTGFIYAGALAVTAFFLVPTYEIEGYLISIVLANIVAIGYAFGATKSYKYISIKCISIDYYKEMIRYSIPLIPNTLMFWIVSSLNRPFLENCVGVASIGLLAIANKFASILSMVFQLFAQSWQVSVFEEIHKKDFNLFFNRVMRFVFTLLMLVACVITLCSHQILGIITTPSFYPAAIYLGPLCFAMVVGAMGSMLGTIFAVYRKSGYYFYTSLVGALASLLLNIIAVPIWGIWGAIFASVVSYILIYVTRLFCVKAYVKFADHSYYVILTVGFGVLALLNCYSSIWWLKLFVITLVICFCLLRNDVRNGLVGVINMIKKKI